MPQGSQTKVRIKGFLFFFTLFLHGNDRWSLQARMFSSHGSIICRLLLICQVERTDVSLSDPRDPVVRGTRFPGHSFYQFPSSTIPANSDFTGKRPGGAARRFLFSQLQFCVQKNFLGSRASSRVFPFFSFFLSFFFARAAGSDASRSASDVSSE